MYGLLVLTTLPVQVRYFRQLFHVLKNRFLKTISVERKLPGHTLGFNADSILYHGGSRMYSYRVAKVWPRASLTWTMSNDPGCLSRWVPRPTRPKLRPPVIMHTFPAKYNRQKVVMALQAKLLSTEDYSFGEFTICTCTQGRKQRIKSLTIFHVRDASESLIFKLSRMPGREPC